MAMAMMMAIIMTMVTSIPLHYLYLTAGNDNVIGNANDKDNTIQFTPPLPGCRFTITIMMAMIMATAS